jgi:hypothetical protein
MKATNKYCEFDVLGADKYVKRLFPNADYMVIEDSYVMVLERSDEVHDKSTDYRYYNINGKQYVSVYTNSYDYLKKAYKPKKKYEQMTLF